MQRMSVDGVVNEEARGDEASEFRTYTSKWSQIAFHLSKFPIAKAMQEAVHEGYTLSKLKADVVAGIVVGVVALPLSMALAIATGVPPQLGLYTAIVSGSIAAMCGGSRVTVTGPTAAFVVILQPIVTEKGLGGLLIATMIAGAIQIAMGLARLGKFVVFVPYPVTLGFTTGIALVIGISQFKDALGVVPAKNPEYFHEKTYELFKVIHNTDWASCVVALVTFVVIMLWPMLPGKLSRIPTVLPAPLVGLGMGVLVSRLLAMRDIHVATIASRFSYIGSDGQKYQGIPQGPPMPALTAFQDNNGEYLSFDDVLALVPAGASIAMQGAIESLLSATVADGMTPYVHDPNSELVAQGLGNVFGPLFECCAATAALSRTATNVKAGAISPIAAIVHGLFILGAMVALAPMMGYLPMAGLAGLLFRVAITMSEYKDFIRFLRHSTRGDIAVLLICFFLTVFLNMIIAISVGLVLAAMLFIMRVTAVGKMQAYISHSDSPNENAKRVPPGCLYYHIQGPMFFGFASVALANLGRSSSPQPIAIIDLSAVPAIDGTGIRNLAAALNRVKDRFILLCGVNAKVAKRLEKQGGLKYEAGILEIFETFELALEKVKEVCESSGIEMEEANPELLRRASFSYRRASSLEIARHVDFNRSASVSLMVVDSVVEEDEEDGEGKISKNSVDSEASDTDLLRSV